MAKGTPATLALAKAGVSFRLHEYDYDPDAPKVGLQAAEALGFSPARVFKTLMARVTTSSGSSIVCAVIPSDCEMSLKRLAAAAKARDAAMLPVPEAERATGYHVGGISPFGQKRRAPCFIEESALSHDTVIVNGGRRGLQIEIAPADLVKLLGATVAALVAA